MQFAYLQVNKELFGQMYIPTIIILLRFAKRYPGTLPRIKTIEIWKE